MRLLLLIVLLLAFTRPSLAYELLVVQDQHSAVYDTVIKATLAALNVKERIVILSDAAETDLTRIVREDHPRAVLAVGGKSLFEVYQLHRIPVVSVFSYAPQSTDPPRGLARITMQVPAERFAALFRSMGFKRIGILLSSRTSAYAVEAATTMQKAGIRLVIRDTKTPREVGRQLDSLRDQVDAIWMIADPVIITPDSVDQFALFSMQQRIPYVSYTLAHLRKGAIAAFGVNPNDLGVQAAEILNSIFNGAESSDAGMHPPHKHLLRYNSTTLGHFSLPTEPLRRLGGME